MLWEHPRRVRAEYINPDSSSTTSEDAFRGVERLRPVTLAILVSQGAVTMVAAERESRWRWGPRWDWGRVVRNLRSRLISATIA